MVRFFYCLVGICLGYASTAQNPGHENLSSKIINELKRSRCIVNDINGKAVKDGNVVMQRNWSGNVCKSSLLNKTQKPIRLSNIILFEITGSYLNKDFPIYGEGFQMLHQVAGTLGKPEDIGEYADISHYKINGIDDRPTAYGLFTMMLSKSDHLLLGFSSCRKFIGRISFSVDRITISIDPEGLVLQPGALIQLEDFVALKGNDGNLVLSDFSGLILKNHPAVRRSAIPTGWCSWYCYGPDVNDSIIQVNLDGFSKTLPELKYIQIDDGYQPFMGDWLEDNPAYGSITKTINEIRARGFEPAIWIAPFIAEKASKLFRSHPGWFVKDVNGQPLNSADIGFGGWRNGPWYALDGTNPEAQEYFKKVIKTMREQWGVNYFKLDANYWGAIHNGYHYDKTATRIEAYRRGMQAILEACDSNTVVLGCNAPIWPSLGLVTAMRTSNDINRDWNSFKNTGKENLLRSWQNGKLWTSDPDCLLLADNTALPTDKKIPFNEWVFHATVLHATGGMVLSGDKFDNLGTVQFEMIKKMIHPTGKGAKFSDSKMQTGFTDVGDKQYYYFFNWGDTELTNLTIKLKAGSSLVDYWSGKDIGIYNSEYTVPILKPHSAILMIGSPK
ncbi:MAG: glycoside hydrolase family 36 protein [Ferruginibacter sp.]